MAPSYAQESGVVQVPCGTCARVAAHPEGFGGTVGGGPLGHFSAPPKKIGDAQRFVEQTTTVLHRGLKSSPYSQRRPSLVHAESCAGAVCGQSGALTLPSTAGFPG